MPAGDEKEQSSSAAPKNQVPWFTNLPLFHAAWLFAAGIVTQLFLYLPLGNLAAILALSFLVAMLAAWRVSRWMLPAVALVFYFLGFFCAQIEPLPSPHRELLAMSDGLIHTVEGDVVRIGDVRTQAAEEDQNAPAEQLLSLDLKVHRVEKITEQTDDLIPISGGVRLTLFAAPEQVFPKIACGDRVRVNVRLDTPQHYADPGVWDRGAYLREQGIDLLGSAKVQRFEITRQRQAPSLHCQVLALQRASSARLMQLAENGSRKLPNWLRLSSDDTAMLAAMIAGDRSFLTTNLRAGFERTGSFHLLVVSGLHLAVVAGFVFALSRWLRLGRIWATLLTIGLSSCYAVLTGLGQPVLRSLLMVTLYLCARLIFRERSPLNAIGFAGLCLLTLQPHALLEASLQMTLLSVVVIAGLAAPLLESWITPWLRGIAMLEDIEIDPALVPRVAQFRVVLRMYAERLQMLAGKWLAWKAMPFLLRLLLRLLELMIVSALMEMAMSLPMAVYFHRFTVAALPVNILLVPFIGVLLPSALLTFLVALVWPSAVSFPAAIPAALLHLITFMIQWVGNIGRSDIRIPEPGPTSVVAFLVLLAVALVFMPFQWWGRAVGVTALLSAALIVVLPRPLEFRKGVLEVEAIDVGQGDALLLITPDGKTLLVDGGGFGGAPQTAGIVNHRSNFDIGEDVVSPVLWSRGIHRLDVVALSHAHSDHMDGLHAILRNFHPRELWVGKNPRTDGYQALLAEAAQLGVAVQTHLAGDRLFFGGTQISVLAPDANYQPGIMPSNNDSLVLRVNFGQTAVLLEGDAESPVEQEMVKRGGLKSMLLKVGHHGSLSSTTPEFLAAVAPTVGVISVGKKNHYEHPRLETLQKLQDARVQTFRTDLDGISCFFLDGTKVDSRPMCR